MSDYRKTKTTTSFINYHFVFCPRYRRTIFKDIEVEKRFKELVIQIAKECEFEIIAMETNIDHVHLFLNVLPQYSPQQVMHKIKGITSKLLREEFISLSKTPNLWTRSYFCSTAGKISSQTVEEYVKSQKKGGNPDK